MDEHVVTEFIEFLQKTFGESLRSVLYYTQDDYELRYIRDDVAEEYSDEEIATVAKHLQIDAMSRHIAERRYTHDSLRCQIQSFEGGIEMNFIGEENEGVAVGLDPRAFVTHETFIGKCVSILEVESETTN